MIKYSEIPDYSSSWYYIMFQILNKRSSLMLEKNWNCVNKIVRDIIVHLYLQFCCQHTILANQLSSGPFIGPLECSPQCPTSYSMFFHLLSGFHRVVKHIAIWVRPNWWLFLEDKVKDRKSEKCFNIQVSGRQQISRMFFNT